MSTTTTELTQEEKRIKIAEALGYTRCIGGCQPKGETEPRYWRTPSGREVRVIPDYFNDLNACHEMEKQTPKEYASLLRLIVADAHHIKASDADCLSDNALVKATAAQRAEAFGLSLKLWTMYLTEPFCE